MATKAFPASAWLQDESGAVTAEALAAQGGPQRPSPVVAHRPACRRRLFIFNGSTTVAWCGNSDARWGRAEQLIYVTRGTRAAAGLGRGPRRRPAAARRCPDQPGGGQFGPAWSRRSARFLPERRQRAGAAIIECGARIFRRKKANKESAIALAKEGPAARRRIFLRRSGCWPSYGRPQKPKAEKKYARVTTRWRI